MFVSYLIGLSCHDTWKGPDTKQDPGAHVGQFGITIGNRPPTPLIDSTSIRAQEPTLTSSALQSVGALDTCDQFHTGRSSA